MIINYLNTNIKKIINMNDYQIQQLQLVNGMIYQVEETNELIKQLDLEEEL